MKKRLWVGCKLVESEPGSRRPGGGKALSDAPIFGAKAPTRTYEIDAHNSPTCSAAFALTSKTRE